MTHPHPVRTERAPQALGPYSQAIVAGDLVWASGQIGLDPGTGALVPGGVAEETRQVLANLRAVLEAAGSSLRAVLRCTVYLSDLADFAVMNQVYAEIFGDWAPARSTVQAAALPRSARVEIDAVARRIP
jgi:2-iminobutanoate/2-iminopropanoate deaminase